MTRSTNARVAGFTFILYIAAGLTSVVLSGKLTQGRETAEKLASVAADSTGVGVVVLLGFIQCFSALVLGVTLWALTRDEDADIAMLGLVCRVAEGVVAGLSIPGMVVLLSLAESSGTDAASTAAAHTLARYLLRNDIAVPATFFAVGSTLFCWLLLRGRMISIPLAWLGLIASVLLVICLPLALAGLLRGPILMLMWLPMLVFELVFAVLLLTRGVRADPDRARRLDTSTA